MSEVDEGSAEVNPVEPSAAAPAGEAQLEAAAADDAAAAIDSATEGPESTEGSDGSDGSDASEGSDSSDGEPVEAIRPFHPAPAHLSLDSLDDDDTFRARDEGDVAALAMDIARLGQLFPIDVRLKSPDRYQVVTGFRRVAALKFLHREKVFARLHDNLSDDDAGLIALADAIHGKAVSRDQVRELGERLEANGALSAVARDMLEKALALDEGLAPEEVAAQEEEVDADELASDVTQRLGQINQDLSLLADVFKDLDAERRQLLLEQLKYSAELVAFLEGQQS